MSKKVLGPSKELERTIRIVDQVFRVCNEPYWLCFGGLWGLIMNRGIVPDGDLDLCTYYGSDWNRIIKAFQGFGYEMTCGMQDDTATQNLLYASFRHMDLPHLCLSFWYPVDDLIFFCHDSHHEVKGIGVPESGYWFRGVPKQLIQDASMLRRVEWPGIDGGFKISVPLYPGQILDNLYPAWAYHRQKYVVVNNQVQDDKLDSVYHGGACSRFAVYVKSMRQWSDKKYVEEQLRDAEKKYLLRIKDLSK
jgi:hypothetical protein